MTAIGTRITLLAGAIEPTNPRRLPDTLGDSNRVLNNLDANVLTLTG
jgi:hypothetical protein